MSLIKTDTLAPHRWSGILTDQQRIIATAKVMILTWESQHGGMLMWEMWELKEAAFIQVMRETEVAGSFSEGFTNAQWGAVYAYIDERIRAAQRAGLAWRKRKGDKISPKDIRHGRFLG